MVVARGIGQHRPAALAAAQGEIAVEAADDGGEGALDVVAPEAHLVELPCTGRAEPGEAVELVGTARALDDEADRARRAARRVVGMLGQEEDLALADAQAPLPPGLDDMDEEWPLSW